MIVDIVTTRRYITIITIDTITFASHCFEVSWLQREQQVHGIRCRYVSAWQLHLLRNKRMLFVQWREIYSKQLMTVPYKKLTFHLLRNDSMIIQTLNTNQFDKIYNSSWLHRELEDFINSPAIEVTLEKWLRKSSLKNGFSSYANIRITLKPIFLLESIYLLM